MAAQAVNSVVDGTTTQAPGAESGDGDASTVSPSSTISPMTSTVTSDSASSTSQQNTVSSQKTGSGRNAIAFAGSILLLSVILTERLRPFRFKVLRLAELVPLYSAVAYGVVLNFGDFEQS